MNAIKFALYSNNINQMAQLPMTIIKTSKTFIFLFLLFFFFKSLGWHYNYPWLYYLSNRNGWSIIKDTSFTEVISFDSTSIYHFLEFYIFKFAIDGSFKGSELLQTQFQMCPHSINDGLTFRSFGVSFINRCTIHFLIES